MKCEGQCGAEEIERERWSKSFGDFTETAYTELLELAKQSYVFSGYGEPPDQRHVIWRHDVDCSMHRAVKLAQIESNAALRATYFIYPRSMFYNILSRPIADLVGEIAALGHDIGLHFDPTFYSQPLSRSQVERNVETEANLIRHFLGVEPKAVSFHLYGVLAHPMPDDDVIGGLYNAYSGALQRDYAYVSDSNGVWRFRRLRDVIENHAEDQLHVLTHPEWWTPEPMAPRLRIQRCIDGYALAIGESFDRVVAESGRPNIR